MNALSLVLNGEEMDPAMIAEMADDFVFGDDGADITAGGFDEDI